MRCSVRRPYLSQSGIYQKYELMHREDQESTHEQDPKKILILMFRLRFAVAFADLSQPDRPPNAGRGDDDDNEEDDVTGSSRYAR